MAYVDTQGNPSAKAGTIIVVGGLHALVGLGLAAALTVKITATDEPPPFAGEQMG